MIYDYSDTRLDKLKEGDEVYIMGVRHKKIKIFDPVDNRYRYSLEPMEIYYDPN